MKRSNPIIHLPKQGIPETPMDVTLSGVSWTKISSRVWHRFKLNDTGSTSMTRRALVIDRTFLISSFITIQWCIIWRRLTIFTNVPTGLCYATAANLQVNKNGILIKNIPNHIVDVHTHPHTEWTGGIDNASYMYRGWTTIRFTHHYFPWYTPAV